MSTSLLYHGFGVRGYNHVNVQYKNGDIIFTVEQDPSTLRCSNCNSRLVAKRGKTWRMFRTVPIGMKTVWIRLAIQRVHCMICCLVRRVKVKLADPRRSYTRAFERYALELSRHMTIKDVAQHLNVSWDVIKDIQKRHLWRHYRKPKLKKLKRIAIDEISIGKGHQYLTIVLDLDTGTVVFVGDGKGSDALLPFWKRLKASRAQVRAVAIDMSPAYISAVMENLPKATLVFDHFHIIKLFNEKLTEIRRKLYHQVSTTLEQNILKGTRWLLLKNPENLNEDKDEAKRLNRALEINQPLATAYYMKEDLRQLWAQKTKKAAEAFLQDWVRRARISKNAILGKFANTLMAHRSGILNYYDYPISTGPLEGTNNKIKRNYNPKKG